MKVGVSLPSVDIAFLDSYAIEYNLPSRSAALQAAVQALRTAQLADAYAAAFEDESADWDVVAADGLAGD